MIGTVLIDPSKAFDTINHALLLNKYAHGVRGVKLVWFTEYLKERETKSGNGCVSSDWNHVMKGGPTRVNSRASSLRAWCL